MKDLLDFQKYKIERLQQRVCELEENVNTLSTYCFEALDEQCPKEYKTILKREIYTLKQTQNV